MALPIRITLAGLAGIFLLTACKAPKTDDSQVIARVNDDEVSVHQFNFAVNKQAPRQLDEAERKALLDKLVDRQLAVQAAMAKELDRRPDVMMRLEEARRDILAGVYAEELGNRQAVASNDVIAKYYADHPALFAQRRVYRLRELVLTLDSPALLEARERLGRKENSNAVFAWLRSQQKGSYSEQLIMRPSEQLPIEVADRMLPVQTGDTIAFDAPRGLVIYQVVAIENVPMAWQDAQYFIRRFLKNQGDAQALEADLARLRSTAKIDKKENLLKASQ